jgi:hypothetical protein
VKVPAEETGRIDSELAFHPHTGGHPTGPNWATFLTFASRYIHGPPPLAAIQSAAG